MWVFSVCLKNHVYLFQIKIWLKRFLKYFFTNYSILFNFPEEEPPDFGESVVMGPSKNIFMKPAALQINLLWALEVVYVCHLPSYRNKLYEVGQLWEKQKRNAQGLRTGYHITRSNTVVLNLDTIPKFQKKYCLINL